MAAQGAAVVAVDVDPAMARLTSEAVAGLPNVRVLHRDALAGKHVLSPEVLDAVRSGLAAGPDRRFKLVANLPYNIATPLIIEPAGAPRTVPGADGGDDPARAGRPAGRAGRRAPPTGPSRCWSRPWRRSRSSGGCRLRSSGRGPRSTRRSSPSGPTPTGAPGRRRRLVPPVGAAGLPPPPQVRPPRPGRAVARSSGPRPRSTPGSSRRGSAASSAPRRSTSRNSSRWPMRCANGSRCWADQGEGPSDD